MAKRKKNKKHEFPEEFLLEIPTRSEVIIHEAVSDYESVELTGEFIQFLQINDSSPSFVVLHMEQHGGFYLMINLVNVIDIMTKEISVLTKEKESDKKGTEYQ